MEKRRNNGIIYESSINGLVNQLFQIQRLQDEGLPLQSLADQTFDKIKQLVEMDDTEKLRVLREELKEL